MRRLYYTLKYFGTLNYYKGVDELTFWKWLYGYRISWDTASKLAKIITTKNEQP